MIDITPDDDPQESCLFSPDISMAYNGPGDTKPSKFIPLTESPLVEEYISLRDQFEVIRCSATRDEEIQIPAFIMDRCVELKQVFTQEVGRNAFCPCQSGLKYKKCCGKVSAY